MLQDAKGTAVVTGGGSGIGEACARRFAKDGFDIAIVDQSAEGAERVGNDLRAAGAKVGVYVGDVSDLAMMTAFAEQSEADLGPTTALVTSAGIINNPNTIMAMDLAEHARI